MNRGKRCKFFLSAFLVVAGLAMVLLLVGKPGGTSGGQDFGLYTDTPSCPNTQDSFITLSATVQTVGGSDEVSVQTHVGTENLPAPVLNGPSVAYATFDPEGYNNHVLNWFANVYNPKDLDSTDNPDDDAFKALSDLGEHLEGHLTEPTCCVDMRNYPDGEVPPPGGSGAGGMGETGQGTSGNSGTILEAPHTLVADYDSKGGDDNSGGDGSSPESSAVLSIFFENVVQGVPAAGFILFSFPQELNGQGSNFYLCFPESPADAPSIQSLLSAVGSPEECPPGNVAVSYTSFMANISYGGVAVASILTSPVWGWVTRTPPSLLPLVIKAAPYIVVGVTIYLVIDYFADTGTAVVEGLATVCYVCLLRNSLESIIRIAISLPRALPLPVNKRDFQERDLDRFKCCAVACFPIFRTPMGGFFQIHCYNRCMYACMTCTLLPGQHWMDILTDNLCYDIAGNAGRAC
jgi:hypothetical protein